MSTAFASSRSIPTDQPVIHGDAPGAAAVSVAMPVHNALPYLNASIGSVLAQTFRNFELVIVDDRSTDGSVHVLRAWADRDPRIRLVESPSRLGLSGSSNAVVERARAPIVARMDADDMCHPDRLQRQYEVLSRAADVVLVGTLGEGIDAAGRRVRPRDRWRHAGLLAAGRPARLDSRQSGRA